MSGCSSERDSFCRSERERCGDVVRLKSRPKRGATPLGVLPVFGTLDVNPPGQALRARGGLAGWQEKRVTEFIETHLSERIDLKTLAALVRLSPYHFARAFKRSFGQPPHRYHVTRRMERAKGLLAKFPVTYVAMAVGYSETSSFSAAFRKATGVSPLKFARQSP
jgi:AraC-like DNA-binding protein